MTTDIILTKTFETPSDQADMFGRLRLGSLINMLIRSAVASSKRLGFSFEQLSKQNITWMLGRFSLELYKVPFFEQEVNVRTWPKTVEGMQYIRDFIVYDDNNNTIAKASSSWLAVNIKERRVTKLAPEMDIMRLPEIEALDYLPLKVISRKTTDFRMVKATYYDLDMNGHVTSIRYVDWIMDCFSPDFHRYNYPSVLHINYLKEIKYADEIKLGFSQIDDKKYYFEAENLTSGNIAFRAELEF